MATVTFRRTNDVDSIPIVDGSLVFDTGRNKIFMDNGSTRLQYGGDTDLISNPNDATASNAFNATGALSLFLQKGSVINDKASALSVTQNNIPLGCLAFKEMLGTNNYSTIGDGTVSGALNNLSNRVNTSQNGVNDLVSQLSSGGTPFYFDNKNGKWGWNSSPARGAGTFHPFSSLPATLQMRSTYTGRLTSSNAVEGSIYIAGALLDVYNQYAVTISSSYAWNELECDGTAISQNTQYAISAAQKSNGTTISVNNYQSDPATGQTGGTIIVTLYR